MNPKEELGSILVIRRDNIGDLVCTTPLITALRRQYPKAMIGVLANSYNAPVLDGNPDVDDTYAYEKLKHIDASTDSLSALAKRMAVLWKLRQKKFGLIVLPGGSRDFRAERLAAMLSPGRIVCSKAAESGEHEVERSFSAARTLGIEGPIPALRVVAGLEAVERVGHAIESAGQGVIRPLVGLHISARRPKQRWQPEKFAELVVALHEKHQVTSMLLWSPGAANHPRHPGDDEKAKAILSLTAGRAHVLAWPTTALSDLVGGLSACQTVVCSDGGAMHIAAGLGKPIVCFFGDSSVARWRPWGVRHVVLQPASGHVADVSVEDASQAFNQLKED